MTAFPQKDGRFAQNIGTATTRARTLGNNRPAILPPMERLSSAISAAMPWIIKSCAIGVVLVIIGRVSNIYPIATVGGLLMVPLTLIAGLACLAVVLLAPLWPLGEIIERVPSRVQAPAMVMAFVALLCWWALWGFIATGALADH